ncbi:thioredoxin-like protein [Xylariaceae sp. FL0662B]|nr:thioredoxin-like protein [Xylariaceae sp. FL0662B]
MGGRIDCYIDIASLYSYIAFVQIMKTQDILRQHSVEVGIHPVLLGAINAGSGNTPPWTNAAKAAYLAYDSQRSLRAAGLESVSAPGDLMEAGRTQLPLRALHYIKATHPRHVYHAALGRLFRAFWTEHRVPNTAETLRGVLLSDTPGLFPTAANAAVDEVVRAATAEPVYKDALRRATDEALRRGAFGAPWLWVTDYGRTGTGTGTGNEDRAEPFFGSDRWHFVYEFLGLPYRGVTLLPPPTEEEVKSKL